uniref:alkaline phosphatase n=1 Tax=Schistocephalus solidus TaxID=70667 RepID=A0A183SJK5_SCHSO
LIKRDRDKEGQIMISLLLFYVLLSAMVCPLQSLSEPVWPILTEEISPKYWEQQAREGFATAKKTLPEMAEGAKKAKNVILFLGDGMGLPTVSAGRFFADEKAHTGKPVKFSFEDWDFNTVARTYDLETMVTDSASTKTRTGMLGLTGAIKVKECVAYSDSVKTISVLESAAKAGKATGIVTNARVTHASPAGAFGHSAFRDWESDSDIVRDGKKSSDCMDLAQQLALRNFDINVILGGGQKKFYPKEYALPIDSSIKGERSDGKVLPSLWLKAQKEKGRKAKYAGTRDEFKSINTKQTDYLLGLLAASHLPYVLDRQTGEPSLTDLTTKAIEILQHNPKGFFLFVEGGRIDHAHHANKAKQALVELLEMKEAIEKAVSMVNLEETLIILTADHSHAFELVGQPSRFESLLLRDKGYGPQVKDNKSMLPLFYMNGPGAKINENRANLSEIPDETLQNKDFVQQALVPLPWATHGGDDVGVYAIGPFSWMFHRTVDNTFIAQVMKYALCLEPYASEIHCNTIGQQPSLCVILAFLLLVFRS